MRRTMALAALAAACAIAAPATAAASSSDLTISQLTQNVANPVPEATSFTETIQIANNGPDDATNERITVQVPSAFAIQGANAPAGGGVSVNGNTVTFTVAPLANGATATAVLTLNAAHPATATTTATADSTTSGETDPNPSNDSRSLSTTVVGLTASDSTFPDQVVGTIGAVKTITVTNLSAQSVTLPSTLAFSGDALDFFTNNLCAGSTLAPAAQCTVEARFAPSALGARGATTTFTTGNTIDSLVVTLSGQGVAAPQVQGPPGPQGVPGVAAFKLVVVPVSSTLKARSGRRVTFAYVSTLDANVTLEVLKGSRSIAKISGRARTGANRLRWNGKSGRRKARPGSYALRLTAVNGNQRATVQSRLKLTR